MVGSHRQRISTIHIEQALSSLTFPYPNQKRLAVLVQQHVAGKAVPGVDQVNRQENILLQPTAVQPCVDFTATVDQVLTALLLQAVPLYAEEQYVLLWMQGRGMVLLKEGAGARAYARAMWQAAWLDQHVQRVRADRAAWMVIDTLAHAFVDLCVRINFLRS